MRRNFQTFYLILILSLWAFNSSITCQTTAARFLLNSPSARSMAMGNTGTAVYDDAFAVFYNPAALAFQKPLNITGSFVEPLPFDKQVEYSSLSITLAQHDLGTFALSGNIYALGNSVWTGEDTPQILGTYNSKAWVGRFSYANLLTKNLAFGVSLNFLRYRLTELEVVVGGEKGNGITNSIFFNLGFLFRNFLSNVTYNPGDFSFSQNLKDITSYVPKKGISIGISLLNFGPKITFIDHKQADNLPALISLGISYYPVNSRMVSVAITTDLEKQIHEESTFDYVHSGLEYNFLSLISMRTGYVWDTYKPKRSYQTFGFGLSLKYLSINIARYTRALLPNWHYSARIDWEI